MSRMLCSLFGSHLLFTKEILEGYLPPIRVHKPQAGEVQGVFPSTSTLFSETAIPTFCSHPLHRCNLGFCILPKGRQCLGWAWVPIIGAQLPELWICHPHKTFKPPPRASSLLPKGLAIAHVLLLIIFSLLWFWGPHLRPSARSRKRWPPFLFILSASVAMVSASPGSSCQSRTVLSHFYALTAIKCEWDSFESCY